MHKVPISEMHKSSSCKPWGPQQSRLCPRKQAHISQSFCRFQNETVWAHKITLVMNTLNLKRIQGPRKYD